MQSSRILALEGNRQRLDGGSMYGNAPRVVWERWSPPDEVHRIALACRCMLVELVAPEGSKPFRVLLETGIGVFFDPALRERYGVDDRRSGHVAVPRLPDAHRHPEGQGVPDRVDL